MPKITANRARGLINKALHQMTLGKETSDLYDALKILNDKRLEIESFIFIRGIREAAKLSKIK